MPVGNGKPALAPESLAGCELFSVYSEYSRGDLATPSAAQISRDAVGTVSRAWRSVGAQHIVNTQHHD